MFDNTKQSSLLLFLDYLNDVAYRQFGTTMFTSCQSLSLSLCLEATDLRGNCAIVFIFHNKRPTLYLGKQVAWQSRNTCTLTHFYASTSPTQLTSARMRKNEKTSAFTVQSKPNLMCDRDGFISSSQHIFHHFSLAESKLNQVNVREHFFWKINQ